MTEYFRKDSFKTTIALFVSAIVVLSCEDKTPKASAIDDDKNTPTTTIRNLAVDYTENGVVRIKIDAPLVEQYMMADEPYSVFSEGFHLRSYNADSVLQSEIVADYALNKEKPEELWQAIGNVVVINFLEKQELRTDTLYWNRAQRRIYTDAPVYIKLSNGTDTYGANGMWADEQFENYQINAAHSGHIYYEEGASDSTQLANPPADPVEE